MANSGGGCFLPNENQTITGGMTFADGATLTGATLSTSTLSSPTITTPTISGTVTASGVETRTNTVTAATIATTRYEQSSLTLTPATTISTTGGGSLAAVRGDVTLTTGKTFVDGFLYGVQGKFTLNGTMAEVSAGRAVGVLGQVDMASGTVTSGQVSAVWADMQGAPTISNTEVNVLRVTNSSSNTLNAMVFFYGQSTYFFTAGRDGGTPTYFGATTPTSLAKSLKINVSGTDYYIGLYTAAS